MTDPTEQRILVTGANSGLGFEAAAQLADAGYGSIVLACRSGSKADEARQALIERTGKDPFETLVVELSSVTSSSAAVGELIDRGLPFDALLLNAGMVPNSIATTDEGLEVCFASSLVGHHLLTTELIKAGLLQDEGRVVIVGSEAANGDLPKALGMSLPPSVTSDGDQGSREALIDEVAHGRAGLDGTRQYAVTKVVSAWWAAGMQERYEGKFNFFNVSPGSNMGTNAARHSTGAFKLMVGLMRRVGHLFGMNQSVDVGAQRYVDVLRDSGSFIPGNTYTSPEGKLTGALTRRTERHTVRATGHRAAVAELDRLAVVEA